MRLQAEPPAWMRQAVLQRGRCIRLPVGAVHRLQEEMIETEMGKLVRLRTDLGKDEFELIPAGDDQVGSGLGTDAEPIDALLGFQSSVRLHGDLEPFGM